MSCFRARRSHFLLALWIACGLLLAGCGERGESGDPAQPPGPSEPWSEPVAVRPAAEAGDGVRSAADLLADLRTRILSGRGHADASYQRSVEDVSAVLWDANAEALEDLAGARAHLQVAAIVGEVSAWLVASPSARAERRASHPTDLALHDAFLKAAAEGPEAYRLWCGAGARTLLLEHREATYKKLMERTEPAPRVDGPGVDGQGR